jgi:hypothetical protein
MTSGLHVRALADVLTCNLHHLAYQNYRLFRRSQRYQKPKVKIQAGPTHPNTAVCIRHFQQSDGKLSSGGQLHANSSCVYAMWIAAMVCSFTTAIEGVVALYVANLV